MTPGLPCQGSWICTLWTRSPWSLFFSPSLCVCKWDHGLASASSLPMLCFCLVHPHGCPPPGLYCFFLFLLIQKVSVQNTFPTPTDLQVSHFLDISDLPGRVSKIKSRFPFVLTMSYQVLCVCGNHCLFICLVYTVLQFNFSEN